MLLISLLTFQILELKLQLNQMLKIKIFKKLKTATLAINMHIFKFNWNSKSKRLSLFKNIYPFLSKYIWFDLEALSFSGLLPEWTIHLFYKSRPFAFHREHNWFSSQ